MKKTTLDIDKAGKVCLPLRTAVTQTYGIIAKKGRGKTYTGMVLVEEMMKCGQQVIILDPLDVWWGLKSSRTGNKAGYPVVVFGDPDLPHTDLPLTAEAGVPIADAVINNRISAIISMAHLDDTKRRSFAAQFIKRAYQLKAKDKRVVHVVVDEADEFAPQSEFKGSSAASKSAMDAIVRRGRSRGFGVSMITQRPAAIAKNILSQIEVLITLQLTSPQDRKAVLEWVKANGTDKQKQRFFDSLATLDIGQAWVWSPSWLEMFKKVRIRRKRTFDSSATPEVGAELIAPKKLAKADLAALREAIQAQVEEAEANDPKLLKKKLDQALKELVKLKSKSNGLPEGHTAITTAELDRLIGKAVGKAVANTNEKWRQHVKASFKKMRAEMDAIEKQSFDDEAPSPTKPEKRVPVREDKPKAKVEPKEPYEPTDSMIPKYEREVLIALGRHAGSPMTASALAITAKKSARSSRFHQALACLRKNCYLDGTGELYITEDGKEWLGDDFVAEPLDPQEKRNYWMDSDRLKPGARLVLQAFITQYPDTLTAEEVAHHAGVSFTSSSFHSALSTLRKLKLIESPSHGRSRASKNLF